MRCRKVGEIDKEGKRNTLAGNPRNEKKRWKPVQAKIFSDFVVAARNPSNRARMCTITTANFRNILSSVRCARRLRLTSMFDRTVVRYRVLSATIEGLDCPRPWISWCYPYG